MLKKFFGAGALVAALMVVPLTLQKSDDGSLPELAFAEACAEGGGCCISSSDFCLMGGDIVFGFRSSLGKPCDKPSI
ncbi:MAG TPA: hypothetical protein VGA37_07265 [Gemmatimonadales bacterium]